MKLALLSKIKPFFTTIVLYRVVQSEDEGFEIDNENPVEIEGIIFGGTGYRFADQGIVLAANSKYLFTDAIVSKKDEISYGGERYSIGDKTIYGDVVYYVLEVIHDNETGTTV